MGLPAAKLALAEFADWALQMPGSYVEWGRAAREVLEALERSQDEAARTTAERNACVERLRADLDAAVARLHDEGYSAPHEDAAPVHAKCPGHVVSGFPHSPTCPGCKSEKFCPKCGQPITESRCADGSAACPECGTCFGFHAANCSRRFPRGLGP